MTFTVARFWREIVWQPAFFWAGNRKLKIEKDSKIVLNFNTSFTSFAGFKEVT